MEQGLKAPTGALAAAAIGAALALAGCTPAPDAAAAVVDESNPFADAIEWAQEDGASEEQIGLMTDGELTFEEVSGAVDRAFACLEALGSPVTDLGIDSSAGYPVRDYAIQVPATEYEAGPPYPSDVCLEEHSFFVEMAWYDAPQSVAGRQQKLESVRPQVIECLSDIGIGVPDAATYDELLDLNLDGYVNSGTDCVVDAGIPSY